MSLEINKSGSSSFVRGNLIDKINTPQDDQNQITLGWKSSFYCAEFTAQEGLIFQK